MQRHLLGLWVAFSDESAETSVAAARPLRESEKLTLRRFICIIDARTWPRVPRSFRPTDALRHEGQGKMIAVCINSVGHIDVYT